MPVLTLESVREQINQRIFWPLYWIHGAELYEADELLESLRLQLGLAQSGPRVGEITYHGDECEARSVVDQALNAPLWGSAQVILVRQAHLIKNPEVLSELAGPAKPLSPACPWVSVVVALAKDLDQRRKFAKTLIQRAAVIACKSIQPEDRPAWIIKLAERRGVNLAEEQIHRLSQIGGADWSLGRAELEIEKAQLLGSPDEDALPGDWAQRSPKGFLIAFFKRKRAEALAVVAEFAHRPEVFLPLLGLMAWNVRQAMGLLLDQQAGTRLMRINPYVAETLRGWLPLWQLDEIQQLQLDLQGLDFGCKQTPLMPLGLWHRLVWRYCH